MVIVPNNCFVLALQLGILFWTVIYVSIPVTFFSKIGYLRIMTTLYFVSGSEFDCFIIFSGIAAGISGDLSGEDIARFCIDCKADIIMVQNEQILKKVIYSSQFVYTCN